MIHLHTTDFPWLINSLCAVDSRLFCNGMDVTDHGCVAFFFEHISFLIHITVSLVLVWLLCTRAIDIHPSPLVSKEYLVPPAFERTFS